MTETITTIGLDVHKMSISVAVAGPDVGPEAVFIGEIANRPREIAGMLGKLAARHGALALCYEAGPCGYGIHRLAKRLGHDCMVVAPSLIPKAAGRRVKTDRRDALDLARLHRAGQLTAVWVPDAAHEAMRDLVRAREAAMRALRQTRQQLHSFLLRHDRIWQGLSNWSRAHERWLDTQTFEHAAQQIVFEDARRAIAAAKARLQSLDQEITRLLPDYSMAPVSMAPVVAAFQGLRGVSQLAAVTACAEVGDFRRFDNPRQLMAYLGLVPSEHSSGSRQRRGAITKAGNSRLRRILVEGAWSYRLPARVATAKRAKLEPLEGAVPGHRLEGPAPALRPLPPDDRPRQARQPGHRRHRPRNGRLPVGHPPATPRRRKPLATDPPTPTSSSGDIAAQTFQPRDTTRSHAHGWGRRRYWGTLDRALRPSGPARQDRGSPGTQKRKCGSQPAHKSLIHRRLTRRLQPWAGYNHPQSVARRRNPCLKP